MERFTPGGWAEQYAIAINHRDAYDRRLNEAVEELRTLKQTTEYRHDRMRGLRKLCSKHHISVDALMWHLDNRVGISIY